MAMGITETVSLAASLVFAIPLGVFGVTTLLDGNTFIGGVVIVVAVLMVVLPRRLTTPTDVPLEVAEKAVGSAVKTPDETDDDASK
jgi:hypothetical protein